MFGVFFALLQHFILFSICAGQDATRVWPEGPADACSGRSFIQALTTLSKQPAAGKSNTVIPHAHGLFSFRYERGHIYTFEALFTVQFCSPPLGVSDKHVDSKPVLPPLATHSGSSAIDLWLRSASCNLRCALPTGPSSPHRASATMNRSLNRSPRERRATEPMGLCHKRRQRGSSGFRTRYSHTFQRRTSQVFFNYWATRPVSGCRLSNL